MIIWQIAGFVVCFILLFVFIAKYHAALEEEQDLEEEIEEAAVSAQPQAPVFKPRAALLQATQAPAALELADLKEQVKTLHYHVEELKMSTQKQEGDLASQVARLEARINTFEQEYVNKLQPTLLRVIEELEHMKSTDAPSAKEQPQEEPQEELTMPQSRAPVPELPEEELKF